MRLLVTFINRIIVSLSYRRIPLLSWIARKLQWMDDFDWNTYAYSTGYHSEEGPFGTDFTTTFSIKLVSTDTIGQNKWRNFLQWQTISLSHTRINSNYGYQAKSNFNI